jgi:hypothetical protein
VGGLSQEIFIYGGKGWTDFFALLSKVNNAMQLGPFQALLSGNLADVNKAQARAVLRELQKNREMIKAPEFVIGFKLEDANKAAKQLTRLEKLAAGYAKEFPQFKGRVKRAKAGGGDFVTLDLDGSMIPWDDVPLSEVEENKGEFDDLVKHLKKTHLTVSVGVKGSYLLVGVSETVKDLAKLGGKGKSLADRDEMKPLAKHANKPIISVGYASKAFLSSVMGGQADYAGLASSLKDLVGKTELADERKKAIQKDIDALASDLKQVTPTYGAAVSFAFLTKTGIDSYSYAHEQGAKYKGLNVTLQNHFGGTPIFAGAMAFNADGKVYATGVKWIKKAYGHAEAIFLDMADDDSKDAYKKGTKAIFPILKRLDSATTKLLIPSLKESGVGLVVDAKWSSKQWHKEMPEAPKAMPMLEVGLLLGLSDAKKFTAAMKEYRTTLNELYEKARESAPNKENVPEFKIPVPESEQGKNGMLYFYPIPEEAGLDKQFKPVAGIGKDILAITLSPKHTERLLARTPLKVKSGPLARKGDLVSVCVLDWDAFIDAVSPWVEFGIQAAILAKADEDGQKKAKELAEGYIKQARVGFQVLKCFKGATSVSYVEDDALVTWSRTVIQDLPQPKDQD